MARHWYPRYMGDYANKTAHLSLMEHGAYALLMDHYYATGKPLSANALVLHRVCKALAPDEQAAVQSVIEQFFELTEKGYMNFRAEIEITKSLKISDIRRVAQAEKERKRLAKAAANAGANAPSLADTTTTTATEGKKEAVVVAARIAPPYVAVGKEIARLTGWDQSPNWFGDYTRVDAWLKAGWVPDLDIYPTVSRLMAGRSGPPSSMKYFERAIADAYAARNAPTPKGTANARPDSRPTKTDRAKAALLRSSQALGIIGESGGANATNESDLSVFSGIEAVRERAGGAGEHKSDVSNGAGAISDGKNTERDGVLSPPQQRNADAGGHSDDN